MKESGGNRLSLAAGQMRALKADLDRLVNRRWHRWIGVAFGRGGQSVILYRLDRAMFLALGRGWKGLRTLLSPVFWLLSPLLPATEIHYEAEIGPGLQILHPSLGVVVSGKVQIGARFTLTGGNCIGTKGKRLERGDIRIGDRVLLGANAVVLGPIVIGTGATISAGSVASSDIPAGALVGGVPARILMIKEGN